MAVLSTSVAVVSSSTLEVSPWSTTSGNDRGMSWVRHARINEFGPHAAPSVSEINLGASQVPRQDSQSSTGHGSVMDPQELQPAKQISRATITERAIPLFTMSTTKEPDALPVVESIINHRSNRDLESSQANSPLLVRNCNLPRTMSTVTTIRPAGVSSTTTGPHKGALPHMVSELVQTIDVSTLLGHGPVVGWNTPSSVDPFAGAYEEAPSAETTVIGWQSIENEVPDL